MPPPDGKEDPEVLCSVLVRESPFSRSTQDHNPACTESRTLVPGVDAIHKRPPSTLQLVHLLSQFLNLFRQTALCQADPGWDGAREGQRGESGSQRGAKRRTQLGQRRRTHGKVQSQGPQARAEDDTKEKRCDWKMSRRLTEGPGQKRTHLEKSSAGQLALTTRQRQGK